MILFPAIDILNGKAVRLYKGDRNKVTEYGDPLEFAEKWAEAGAKWLHVVDLSGAFTGESGIDSILTQIKKRLNISVQSGGGLRSVNDVQRRLDAGADRVVIGTMAACHPDEFALTAYKFPEKVVAGIDARDGMFAVKGWTEQTDITAVYFGKKCRKMGIRYALFTDISKDGTLSGPNTDMLAALKGQSGMRIIASQRINRKAILVIALSFSFGLSVELVPEILSQFPETLKNIFASGITTGGLTAIVANTLIHIEEYENNKEE